ncbi:MAG: hypothetical protein BWY35_00789 [Firmicutes bacterium ADurb.Bin248]|jgi:GNAT superfamily N-acetyltransferase|nr:MAG: hypothetical protein BWY35_00789 [Firmicutes bacterium ADurb.Bin248]HPK14630.1 GNAT family N-acetyltransferase [Clostridia bacterium]
MHITIERFDPTVAKQCAQLTRLMSAYFPEIGAGDMTPYVPKIVKLIADSVATPRFWAFLGRTDNEYAGFVIAQIDSSESDWNKREGWGFIRELYVAPAYRKRAMARQLVAVVEQAMHRSGALQAYLTTPVPDFWRKLGYSFSGEVYGGNGYKIGEKIL